VKSRSERGLCRPVASAAALRAGGRSCAGLPAKLHYLSTFCSVITISPFSRMLAHGPPEPMSFRLSLPNTVILILSSVALWFSDRGIVEGIRWKQLVGLLIGIVLGAIFVAIQLFEWKSKMFSLTSHPYGSLYFTITGFHLAHVIVGLLILLALLVWSAFGYFGPRRDAPVSIGTLYWHFVDVVWLAVFFTFYVTPHLG
jgi:cytochrome c oxidase subunit III